MGVYYQQNDYLMIGVNPDTFSIGQFPSGQDISLEENETLNEIYKCVGV